MPGPEERILRRDTQFRLKLPLCKACHKLLVDGSEQLGSEQGDFTCASCEAPFRIMTIQGGFPKVDLPFVQQDSPLQLLAREAEYA